MRKLFGGILLASGALVATLGGMCAMILMSLPSGGYGDVVWTTETIQVVAVPVVSGLIMAGFGAWLVFGGNKGGPQA
jgi:hypothetical protein